MLTANVIEGIIATIVAKWSGKLPPPAEAEMRAEGMYDEIFCLSNQYTAALSVLESAGCVRKPGAAEMTDDEKRKTERLGRVGQR